MNPKLYGEGENVRDWIHVEDHNLAVLDNGRICEAYLIGADGEMKNKDVVEMILELMGRDPQDYEHVSDRPGHDMRYAIDATKLCTELGWKPRFTNFRDGLKNTVELKQANEAWWRPAKTATEAKYKQLGR